MRRRAMLQRSLHINVGILVSNDFEPFPFVERNSGVHPEEAKVDRQPRSFGLSNQAVEQGRTNTATLKLWQKVYLAQDQARGLPKDEPDSDIHSIERDDIRPARGEFMRMALALPFLVPLAECLLHVGSHHAFRHQEADLVITVLRWPECYPGVHPIAL